MITRSKNIEIFLPSGEPAGVKIAKVNNRNIEVTYIPRACLADVQEWETLQGCGIYFLVASPELHAKPLVYIGETENIITRLKQHNAEKDFWEYAITAVSKDRYLTKTHAKFLEWLCYCKAKNANRCTLDNGIVPQQPHVQKPMEADLYDNFENIDLLASTFGLNIFQSLAETLAPKKPASHTLTLDELLEAMPSSLPSKYDGHTHIDRSKLKEIEHDEIYSISVKNSAAKGRYTKLGFLVFAGSHIAKKMTESFEKSYPKIRDALIRDGILADKGDYYELIEDYVFSAPSTASDVVLGLSSNGWKEWKTSDGRTLHQVTSNQDI